MNVDFSWARPFHLRTNLASSSPKVPYQKTVQISTQSFSFPLHTINSVKGKDLTLSPRFYCTVFPDAAFMLAHWQRRGGLQHAFFYQIICKYSLRWWHQLLLMEGAFDPSGFQVPFCELYRQVKSYKKPPGWYFFHLTLSNKQKTHKLNLMTFPGSNLQIHKLWDQ